MYTDHVITYLLVVVLLEIVRPYTTLEVAFGLVMHSFDKSDSFGPDSFKCQNCI